MNALILFATIFVCICGKGDSQGDPVWIKKIATIKCRTTMQFKCTQRYLDSLIDRAHYTTTAMLRGKKVDVSCDQDEVGLYCNIIDGTENGKEWFSCYRVNDIDVMVQYERVKHRNSAEYDGICEALRVYEEFALRFPVGFDAGGKSKETWSQTKLDAVMKCRTQLQFECSQRYIYYKVVSFVHNTTVRLKRKTFDVHCTEDESGMYCSIKEKSWFRCYCWDEQSVMAEYEIRHHHADMEYEGICEALGVFESVVKLNPAEPVDLIDWRNAPDLRKCYETLKSSCKSRYLHENIKPNEFVKQVRLNNIGFAANCSENSSGVNCIINHSELWFKCFRARGNKVILIYQKELHQSASEFSDICEALDMFNGLIDAPVFYLRYKSDIRDYEVDRPPYPMHPFSFTFESIDRQRYKSGTRGYEVDRPPYPMRRFSFTLEYHVP